MANSSSIFRHVMCSAMCDAHLSSEPRTYVLSAFLRCSLAISAARRSKKWMFMR